jgi:hypothetical protein
MKFNAPEDTQQVPVFSVLETFTNIPGSGMFRAGTERIEMNEPSGSYYVTVILRDFYGFSATRYEDCAIWRC